VCEQKRLGVRFGVLSHLSYLVNSSVLQSAAANSVTDRHRGKAVQLVIVRGSSRFSPPAIGSQLVECLKILTSRPTCRLPPWAYLCMKSVVRGLLSSLLMNGVRVQGILSFLVFTCVI